MHKKWKYSDVICAGCGKYLMGEKNKQTKISDLKYEKLEMQEYLNDGNRNTRISKLIFKARARNLNIKIHKKWKYSDVICVGCGKNDETENELLVCSGFGNEKENEELSYSWLFDNSVTKMVKVALEIDKRLKRRKKLRNVIQADRTNKSIILRISANLWSV